MSAPLLNDVTDPIMDKFRNGYQPYELTKVQLLKAAKDHPALYWVMVDLDCVLMNRQDKEGGPVK